MTYCKATKKSPVTGQLILRCDLDEGHLLVHPKHYDKREQVTWNTVSNQPSPLPETRINASKHSRKPSVDKSVAAHTGQFEVIQ